MSETLQKLTAARTRLILDKPFLGALVLRLPMQEAQASWCTTTATDARSLYYNRDYIESLGFSQVQFVLAHEALHCGLSHFARREHRDKHRWDVACDHAVNLLLLEDGLELPPDALFDDAYRGLSAEEIYPMIRQDTDEQPLDNHIYDDSAGNSDQHRCEDLEATPQSDSAPLPLSMQEREQLNIQWQQRLAGAAQQASLAGKMNGSVARLIDRLLRSSVPWRTLLARFMSGSARVDYNLMRPSQRRTGDAILPSLHARQVNVVAALDTSGSIEQNEMNEFCAEVNAIKGLVNARITLLACDSELDESGPWVFESWQQLVLPETLKGNGGTDFTPVFDWLQMQNIQPDLVIYFTDGQGRFPDHPPSAETLWLVKGSASVPWGQRIQLN